LPERNLYDNIITFVSIYVLVLYKILMDDENDQIIMTESFWPVLAS